MKKRKILLGFAAVAMTTTVLAGCSTARTTEGAAAPSGSASGAAFNIQEGDTIGVALPARTSENWVLAGKYFEETLTEAGFEANIQYANQTNPVPDQQSQISNMVTQGVSAIIIGAADGSQLGTQVAAAKRAGIPVIAWDRNILNTEDVDYYVAFNNYQVGVLQADALLEGMKARDDEEPYQVELIAGSPDDANAPVFFNGAMSVLKPLIDDGTIEVASDQTEFSEVATQGWLPQNAQSRMTNVVTQFHDDVPLDGILSPNDTLGRAAIQAVRQAGQEIPVVTGQDSEEASIPLIMDGTQYMTIYKDTRLAAQAATDLVVTLAAGETPDTVEDEQNDNGSKIVPTIQLDPVAVTAANAAEVYKDNDTLYPLTQE